MSKLITRQNLTYILVAILTITTVWFALKYKEATNETVNEKASEVEAQETLDELGQHILITEKDKPSIVTIVDVDKLKAENEVFYANAQNGDQLIIFPGRAILFRRSDDIIINIAPIINTNSQLDTNRINTSPTTKKTEVKQQVE